jgi:DHA1 family multidrug/chloramphenicol efflux transport protein-like MFS transporter
MALALYEVAIYLSNDAYLPALPAIAGELFISNYLAEFTITAWFLGSASTQLLLGPVADALGRRPVLLWGGIVFFLSSLGCAFTDNIYLLLLCRFIQGASVPSMMVAGYASIHEIFSREKAVHILALMMNIMILAPAFGPLLGAVILYCTTWRWVFVILAIWALILIVLLYFIMPETVKADESKKKSGINLAQIIMQYKNILLNKTFISYGIAYQAIFAALITWITIGAFLTVDDFGMTPIYFGIFQALIFGAFIISTNVVRGLTKRFTYQNIVKMGLTISFIGGCYALAASVFAPTFLANLIIGLVLVASGAGLAFPILGRFAIESSEEPMGSRVAIWSALVSASAVLGSVLISFVYNGTLLSFAVLLFVLTLLAYGVSFKFELKQ